MQQATTIQVRQDKDSVIYSVVKFTGYSVAGLFGAFIFIATVIGMQEIPNRIEGAKQQYIDYQVKIKNPKYVNVNSINE